MKNDDAQKLLDTANEYRDNGLYVEAAEKLRKLINNKPDVPAFWTLLGNTLANLKDWINSEEAFLKALELKPDHLMAILGMGSMLAEKGNMEKVEFNFRKAINLAPDNKLAQDCLDDFIEFGQLTK